MKTVSCTFTDSTEFNQFLKREKIIDSKNLLVTIYSGSYEKEIILDVVGKISCLLPQAQIMGCTTPRQINSGNLSENDIVVIVSVFENTIVQSVLVDLNITDTLSAIDIVKNSLLGKSVKVLNLYAAESNIEYTDILTDLSSCFPDVPIEGGESPLEEDSDHNLVSYVFSKERITSKGFVVCSLSGEQLSVITRDNFVWESVGKTHKVTKSSYHTIDTIDAIPAKEFYEQQIGHRLSENSLLGESFPLICIDDQKNSGIVVNAIPESLSLSVNYNIKSGQLVKLGYGNRSQIVDQGKKMISDLLTNPAQAVFLCVSKYRTDVFQNLGSTDLLDLVFEKPVNGLYTKSEFCFVNGINKKLEMNMAALVLSESKKARIKIDTNKLNQYIFSKNEDYVFHFILEKTQKELDLLSKDLVDQVEKKTKQLEYNYYHDVKTGLYNSYQLEKDLIVKKYTKMALVYIPILYEYKTLYGEIILSEILKAIADFIASYFLSVEAVVYITPEFKFAVCFDNQITDNDFILSCAAFRTSLKNTCFKIDNRKLFLNPYIGIVYGKNDLYNKASMVLHHAVDLHIEFMTYDDSFKLKKIAQKHLSIIEKLRDAITNDRIVPYFQPIFENSSQKITKYEALARMIDNEGNVISPGQFLEEAAYSGLYSEITKIITIKVFEKMKDSPYEFSINIGLKDILDPETRDLIYRELKQSPVPDHVVFEILESEQIQKFSEVIHFIKKIKSFGAKVAIDDFGSGYSNLIYIAKMSLDYIKLDGSIISEMTTDSACESIVKLMGPFAKEIGLKVIAEYVSDKNLQKKIEELGIDFSQGYYIGKPSPDLIPVR